MGNYLIRRLTNADPDFYPLVGPFLGSRQVHRDIGNPIWDELGKVWYVALQNNVVCGFVAAISQSGGVVFCSDYVVPACRERGVYAELFINRIHDYADEPIITAAVLPAAIKVYASHGFAPIGNRGRYTTMRRTK